MRLEETRQLRRVPAVTRIVRARGCIPRTANASRNRDDQCVTALYVYSVGKNASVKRATHGNVATFLQSDTRFGEPIYAYG